MDNIKELVELLRRHGKSYMNLSGVRPMLEAADALEAQAAEIERLTRERDAAVADLRHAILREDECTFCAHCCAGGEPLYRPNEQYLAFCRDCDDLSNFEWRGPQKEE